MNKRNRQNLELYLDAYSFVEFSAGHTVINLARTVELMRSVYKDLYEEHNLSEPKFFVLLLLFKAEEGIPLIEIGKMMMVSRANITTLIERLVKDGYVEKRHNDADKRSIKAYITKEGRQKLESVLDFHKNFSIKLTKSLSEEESQLMNVLLRKLQFGLVEEFNKE